MHWQPPLRLTERLAFEKQRWVSKEETATVRAFVRDQLSGEPDLSTLTLGILKKRYLKHVKCDSLSPEVKQLLKQVVEEELLKMQESEGNSSESNAENKKPQSKRKREEEDKDELLEEKEDKSKKKEIANRAFKVIVCGNDSSDDGEEEEKVEADKKKPDTDSDSSSSLPSLDDEERNGSGQTQVRKKKGAKKDGSSKSEKSGDRAINRLKRYIALCGVKKNYKKLLDDCRSTKSKVAVLKKELEDLGVHGVPSIKKCKRVKKKREEAQELAALDVNNIITTKGRPKRRGAWQQQPDPPPSAYQRSLNSDSDSDQDSSAPKGRKKLTAWANLQGIISDDGDSD
ncbi:HIRA-interacting protein 3-like [Salarias fasciatus]|uniref:HIRA-interacting protein 3-like n=1 Tax=Salarias fasciatus TaxID=181472 RepID=UPI001176B58C|nr:HIRA-interacting protein 3-like [Salarias fasciatus]